MPAVRDVRAVQRNGVIVNLAGVALATWRWVQGRLLIEPLVEDEEFARVLDGIKADGIVEFEPAPAPGGYGFRMRRTRFQEVTPAQLDFALKSVGYFMSELSRPVK